MADMAALLQDLMRDVEERSGRPLPTTVEEFMTWLTEPGAGGYMIAERVGDRHWAALGPIGFNWAIYTGVIGDVYGYSTRWCFDGLAKGAVAFDEWKQQDWAGEPEGWHRHPDTGRRRPNGDKAAEYINW